MKNSVREPFHTHPKVLLSVKFVAYVLVATLCVAALLLVLLALIGIWDGRVDGYSRFGWPEPAWLFGYTDPFGFSDMNEYYGFFVLIAIFVAPIVWANLHSVALLRASGKTVLQILQDIKPLPEVKNGKITESILPTSTYSSGKIQDPNVSVEALIKETEDNLEGIQYCTTTHLPAASDINCRAD